MRRPWTAAFARGRPRGAARDVGAAGHRRAHGAARGGRAPGIRPAGATPSMPAPAAWGGRAPAWPARSAFPRARCAWSAREVGGNFGTRNSCYPEFALVAWAARRLGRPVKWTAERREAFLADYQGRDLAVARRAGARRRRRVPRLSRRQHQQRRRPRRLVPPAQQGHGDRDHGVPRARRGDARARRRHQHLADHAVPQRGTAGGDVRHGAADRPRRPPARLRSPGAAPAKPRAGRARCRTGTRLGAGLRQRRLSGGAGSRGGARGLGGVRGAPGRGAPARPLSRDRRGQLHRAQHRVSRASAPTSPCGPRGGSSWCWARSRPGRATPRASPSSWSSGSGWSWPTVRLITGDTDVTVVGGGAHSARALRLAAVVMAKASDQIVEKGTRIAAWLLEAAEADIEFAARRFRVKGTDRSVDLFEVAAAAQRADAPELPRAARRAERREMPLPSFPYGCAVCEVEVDPETGVVEVVRYTTVDDCGRAVNPDDPARPDPRRHRPGRGPGAVGVVRVRSRDRPAPVGDVDGLRPAPRGHAAAVHDGDQRGALDRRIRSACAAAAKAGRRRRSAPWSTPSSTPSPSSASSTSRCRRRPSASGRRSRMRAATARRLGRRGRSERVVAAYAGSASPSIRPNTTISGLVLR